MPEPRLGRNPLRDSPRPASPYEGLGGASDRDEAPQEQPRVIHTAPAARPDGREKTTRFAVDLPVSWHKRLRIWAAGLETDEGKRVTMVDIVRTLLDFADSDPDLRARVEDALTGETAAE